MLIQVDPNTYGVLYAISVLNTFLSLFPLICLYLYRREKRPRFGVRLAVSAAVYFLVGGAAPLLICLNPMGGLNLNVSLAYGILYLILFFFLYACYQESFMQAVFDYIVCYSFKMLLSTLVSLVFPLFEGLFSSDMTYLLAESGASILFSWAAYALLCRFYLSRRPDAAAAYEPNSVIVGFCAAVFLATLFLDSGQTSGSALNLSYILITAACYVLIIFIQFGFLERNSLKNDMELDRRLWEEREKQLRVTKENMDLVSVKYHDLKHYMGLAGHAGVEIPREEMDKLTEMVDVCDSFVKTGSDTLDTLLTDKAFYWHHNNIRFTCSVDGEKLSFLSTTDLISLFGNALENAAEAVIKLPEEERFLSLAVEEAKGFLLITVENPYAGALTVENGTIVTSKGSPNYHGFGIRSMGRIAEQHGGVLSISTEDHIFSLNISIPIPHPERSVHPE